MCVYTCIYIYIHNRCMYIYSQDAGRDAPGATTYNIQNTAYSIQHTTHNTQYTAHNTQHTTRNTQHTMQRNPTQPTATHYQLCNQIRLRRLSILLSTPVSIFFIVSPIKPDRILFRLHCYTCFFWLRPSGYHLGFRR